MEILAPVLIIVYLFVTWWWMYGIDKRDVMSWVYSLLWPIWVVLICIFLVWMLFDDTF